MFMRITEGWRKKAVGPADSGLRLVYLETLPENSPETHNGPQFGKASRIIAELWKLCTPFGMHSGRK